ncbi:MAG: hypothetical protein ACRCZR_01370 [Cetobacterium sp.]
MGINYEKRIVAFIDILGFKQMVIDSEKDGNEEKIQSIDKALEFFKKFKGKTFKYSELIDIEEDAQKKGVENFRINELLEINYFSDSIIISVKVEKERINEILSTFIVYIAALGNLLIKNGILIRGGIDMGNLIHKNGKVFGSALIKAYNLESAIAIYPRIIISKNLLQKLNYPIESKKDRYPYHQYLERFEDGCIGFTQLTILQVMDSLDDTVYLDHFKRNKTFVLDKTKETIIKGLNENLDNSRVFDKYKWLMNSFNRLIILNDKICFKKIEISERYYNFFYK